MSNSGPKVIAKDVTLSLGILDVKGSLLPILNTEDKNEVKTFYITTCEHHSQVEQYYKSKNCDCTPPASPNGWKPGQLGKGKTVDGKIIEVTPDALAQINDSDLEQNLLEISICDAAEFESQCWPNGSTYWFETERVEGPYSALMTLIVDRSRAFYGRMRLRSEKLYRILPHPEGGFVLQECIRPSEMWHYNAPLFDIQEKDATMAQALSDALMDKFDPESVVSSKVEKMREFLATADGSPLPEKKDLPITKKVDDITSVLEMALAAAQAAKLAKSA